MGFTLLELLVVVAIIAVLCAVLVPSVGRAKLKAKIVAVHSDLRQITVALAMYAQCNANALPPTRLSCASRAPFELPPELAQGNYLPVTEQNTVTKVNFFDRFQPTTQYCYRAPGPSIVNEYTLNPTGATLYVPNDYPACASSAGMYYNDPKVSPVRYAVWSVGPDVNSPKFAIPGRAPVPNSYWCNGAWDAGVITHILGTNDIMVTSP